MKFDRRQFIKSLAVSSGIATAGSLGWMSRLRADDTATNFTRKRFVFCELVGAWDVLLGVDPRDPSVFTEEEKGNTGIQLGHHLLDPQYLVDPYKIANGIRFGPAVPQSFLDLAPKMCVGRGLTMNTLAHQVGRVFWSTGRTPAGINPTAPSIASQIVDQIYECDPDNLGIMPSLAINADVYSNATEPALRPFQIRNATDMLLALRRGTTAISKLVLEQISGDLEAYRESSVLCDPADLDRYGKMTLVRKSQKEVENIIKSDLSAKFDLLNTSITEIDALKTHYGYGTDLNVPSALAAVAAQALKNEMTRCVTLQFANSFDDHDGSWAEDQPADQFAAFDAIGKLYADLAQTPAPEDPSLTLADQTVFVIGSDFSRTPLLNSTQGRDHWPVNACVFIGGGMPEGRVIGASTDNVMESRAIDPESGVAVSPETEGAVTMNPGHWMASLLANEGLSLEHLREEPLPCLTNG